VNLNKMYPSYESAYRTTDETSDNVQNTKRFTYDLNNGTQLTHLLRQFEVVVVQGYADWCQPCKHASKKIEKLAEEMHPLFLSKQLVCLRDNIDLEESPHRDKIDVVPTFFIYVKARLQHVLTGVDFDKLLLFLQQYFHLP